ncbi:MAG: hypothetical protein AWU54_310 [Candidatus Frackibacter sp. T328-2]|nr:MAG: hypothetical protein AWU54_310 [Candidatus Frackibacter sp. T328-2]
MCLSESERTKLHSEVSRVYDRDGLIDKLNNSFGLTRSEIERIVSQTEQEIDEQGAFGEKEEKESAMDPRKRR